MSLREIVDEFIPLGPAFAQRPVEEIIVIAKKAKALNLSHEQLAKTPSLESVLDYSIALNDAFVGTRMEVGKPGFMDSDWKYISPLMVLAQTDEQRRELIRTVLHLQIAASKSANTLSNALPSSYDDGSSFGMFRDFSDFKQYSAGAIDYLSATKDSQVCFTRVVSDNLDQAEHLPESLSVGQISQGVALSRKLLESKEYLAESFLRDYFSSVSHLAQTAQDYPALVKYMMSVDKKHKLKINDYNSRDFSVFKLFEVLKGMKQHIKSLSDFDESFDVMVKFARANTRGRFVNADAINDTFDVLESIASNLTCARDVQDSINDVKSVSNNLRKARGGEDNRHYVHLYFGSKNEEQLQSKESLAAYVQFLKDATEQGIHSYDFFSKLARPSASNARAMADLRTIVGQIVQSASKPEVINTLASHISHIYCNSKCSTASEFVKQLPQVFQFINLARETRLLSSYDSHYLSSPLRTILECSPDLTQAISLLEHASQCAKKNDGKVSTHKYFDKVVPLLNNQSVQSFVVDSMKVDDYISQWSALNVDISLLLDDVFPMLAGDLQDRVRYVNSLLGINTNLQANNRKLTNNQRALEIACLHDENHCKHPVAQTEFSLKFENAKKIAKALGSKSLSRYINTKYRPTISVEALLDNSNAVCDLISHNIIPGAEIVAIYHNTPQSAQKKFFDTYDIASQRIHKTKRVNMGNRFEMFAFYNHVYLKMKDEYQRKPESFEHFSRNCKEFASGHHLDYDKTGKNVLRALQKYKVINYD